MMLPADDSDVGITSPQYLPINGPAWLEPSLIWKVGENKKKTTIKRARASARIGKLSNFWRKKKVHFQNGLNWSKKVKNCEQSYCIKNPQAPVENLLYAFHRGTIKYNPSRSPFYKYSVLTRDERCDSTSHMGLWLLQLHLGNNSQSWVANCSVLYMIDTSHRKTLPAYVYYL